MRILITGATSMIGSALANRLVQEGHRVVAVGRPNSAKLIKMQEHPLVEIVFSNMNEYGTLSSKVKGTIDAAVLMAWNGTRGQDRMNVQMQQENKEANASLLQELIKLSCKTIMTAGSQAEYGPWLSTEALKEDALPQPNTEYGKSKLRFYQTAEAFCNAHGQKLIEPRFFSLFGPDDYDNTLIMSLLRSMLHNEPCNLTECIQMWDYLYIDDAISGLIKLLTENHPGGVYNFGSGECHQLKEFVDKIYEITGSSSVMHYGAVPYPPTGMVSIHPDVTRLRSTGWTPQVSFTQGIKNIMKKYENK